MQNAPEFTKKKMDGFVVLHRLLGMRLLVRGDENLPARFAILNRDLILRGTDPLADAAVVLSLMHHRA